MSKRLSQYIASFDYFDKFLFLLSATSGGISIYCIICSCYLTACRSSNCKFLFWIFSVYRNYRIFLKTTQNKKKKHNKIVPLARSKLNSIERKILEALINNEISHEDFTKIINEEKNYCELKESIRIRKTQRSNTEKKFN